MTPRHEERAEAEAALARTLESSLDRFRAAIYCGCGSMVLVAAAYIHACGGHHPTGTAGYVLDAALVIAYLKAWIGYYTSLPSDD